MLAFGLSLIGCHESAPSELCLPVTSHDGAGQVRFESPQGSMVLAIETGARNLKLFEEGAPWVEGHWLGQQQSYTLWGGAERQLIQQERIELFDGRLRLAPWRQAQAPVHQIASAWGGLVDGWAGIEALFALGSSVSYGEGQICGVRPVQCDRPVEAKPLVQVETEEGPGTFLVDSALVRSVVWGRGEGPQPVSIGAAGKIWAWPFPAGGEKEHYGSGTAGGQPIDGVIAWTDLAQSSWTWDFCTGDFEMRALPPLAPKEALSPLQVHLSNGHIP